MDIQFSHATFIEMTVLSPLNCLDTTDEKQLTIDVWGLFLDTQLCSIKSYVLCQYYTILITVAL